MLVDCKQPAVRPRSPVLSPPASITKETAAPVHSTSTAATTTAAIKEQSIAAKKARALAAAPSQYSAGERQRFVFMDFDNITAGLYSSHRLYQRVTGARSARDLYLNLRALTARICGDDDSDNASPVALQLATYYNSSASMAQALRTHRWQVQKQETVSDTTLQLELFAHLVASPHRDKTLVLVTGDGNSAANNKSFKAIVKRYLEHHWFVEIYTWVHALSESYIDFQRAHPEQLVVRPLDAVFHDLVSLKTNVRATAVGAGVSPPVSAPASPSTSSSSDNKSSCNSEPGAAAVAPVLALAHVQKLQDAFTALRIAAVARGNLPAQVLARRADKEP